MRTINFCTLTSLLLFVSVAHAVSFDCKKATTFVETEICNEPVLGKLDDALSSNYKSMLASNIGSGALTDLKTTQKSWLATRNKCNNKKCLVDTYRNHVDAICDYPVVTGIHPVCISSDEVTP